MRKRGGGNTYGAFKAKLTRHRQEYEKEYREEQNRKTKIEIENNQERWIKLLDKLKALDNEFDAFYDSPIVPERIQWTGEEFEFCFRIIKNRLNEIRRRMRNHD